ncbi:MAG: hypothetical protein GY792_11260 [Gammaproteobacteria bacterium]|nr:hypothetical protein [Gammaproteobacteria bacterium]
MKKFAAAVIAGSLFSTAAFAAQYEVSITNLTRAQSITPILVASHKAGFKLFELGTPASDELAALAEGGATGPLETSLYDSGKVIDINKSDGLLGPGETTTVEINVPRHWRAEISVAAMFIPTNDGFMALNAAKVPLFNKSTTYLSPVYDAGSEPNDEKCENIPGPVCGGSGGSLPHEDDEGYVHIHSGIHGIGEDLDAATYDWRNPAAKITIKRVRH